MHWASRLRSARAFTLISYPSAQVRVRVDGAGLYEGSFAPNPYTP